MINLLNKILNRFGFQLVSIKPDTTLVEATVKFMNETPKYFKGGDLQSTYVGDINYVQERVKGEFPQVSGRTYYQHQVLGKDKTFFNYEGEKFTPQELAERLKND